MRVKAHQFTIDPDGEGWLIECSCGWFAHGMTESDALNQFGEHENETLDKEIIERFLAGESVEGISLYNPAPERGVRENGHPLKRKVALVEKAIRQALMEAMSSRELPKGRKRAAKR